MATATNTSRSTGELNNKLQQQAAPASAPAKDMGIKALMNAPAMKKRFEEILNKRAPQYMTSILNLVNSDTNLQKCEPMSVISSAMVAATLDLPVDKNLGYAWVVPYGNRATFQLGYKGYVQLALRTGKYRHINVVNIHEGELIEWNPLTEKLTIDFDQRKSDAVIGYAGYFELVNGFRKTVYWTRERIETHKKKFSKSDFGWKNDWDAMARKTVIRDMLSHWGILSIEMQNAVIEEAEPRQKIDVTSDGEIIDTDFRIVEERPGPDELSPENIDRMMDADAG